MKFIVLLTDSATAAPDLRQQHMSAHLAFLERNSTQIEFAGPLFEPVGAGAGGLWVVDASDEQAVEGLIQEDPFWPTGLRESFRILRWTQVFANGKRI